jgi:hypothetical protein
MSVPECLLGKLNLRPVAAMVIRDSARERPGISRCRLLWRLWFDFVSGHDVVLAVKNRKRSGPKEGVREAGFTNLVPQGLNLETRSHTPCSAPASAHPGQILWKPFILRYLWPAPQDSSRRLRPGESDHIKDINDLQNRRGLPKIAGKSY